MTTDSMPWRCSRCESISPAGPAPRMPTSVSTRSAIPYTAILRKSQQTGLGEPKEVVMNQAEDDREPPYLYPDYVGTRLRAPVQPLVRLAPGSHVFPPPFSPGGGGNLESALPRQHPGEPLGERIIVTGRVLDSD